MVKEKGSATRVVCDFEVDEAGEACSVLAAASGLSKGRVKAAMVKGAVQVKGRGKWRILRRATAQVRKGDRLAMHYDPELLARTAPPPRLFADEAAYSVWFKPAGWLSQGNAWGDHLSLLRFVEIWFAPKRPVFLVHRIDRETSGLMLVAHSSHMAAKLSMLFQERAVVKEYWAWVRGLVDPAQGSIVTPLDGKKARTDYQCLTVGVDAGDVSELLVTIHSGRQHQIRRHLASIGHPVMGDPAYGAANADEAGLRLVACRLSFIHPGDGKVRDYGLNREELDGEVAVAG